MTGAFTEYDKKMRQDPAWLWAEVQDLRAARDALAAENAALKNEVANKADYAARMYRMNEELKAELERMKAGEPVANAQAVQWRNIKKVVKALADLCFESPEHPKYGHCHVAVTTSLTASDGLDVTALRLEPLYAAQPSAVPVGHTPVDSDSKNGC